MKQGSGYYTDSIDALPLDVFVSAMSVEEVPRPLAKAIFYWFRFRSFIGWRPKATGGEKLVTDLEWRSDPISPKASRAWGPWLEQLDDLEFHRIGWYKSDTIGDKQQDEIWYTNDGETVFSSLNWTKIAGTEEARISIHSYFSDGTEVQTIEIKRAWEEQLLSLFTPNFTKATAIRTKSLENLMQAHQDALETQSPESFSDQAFKVRFAEQSERLAKHLINLGYERELSEKEFRRLVNA